ncbi:hypothetical protein [Methanocaldococcus infernus]
MFKYAIIGSGVSASTVAKELNDDNVVVIEKGDKVVYQNEGKNVEVIYTKGLGGSSIFSLGNAVILKKIEGYKIKRDLYKEIWEELNIKEPSEEFLSEFDNFLLDRGFKKMSKFIDFDKCNKCGLCSRKPCEAKWTPINYLKESKAKIVKNFEVKEIVREKDHFIIEGDYKIRAEKVIVSAGAIGTARLFLDKDERVGKNLFVDTFVTVGGILKDSHLNKHLSMLVYKDYGNFILSPHYSKLIYGEIKKERDVEEKDIVGIMVKIKDENDGIVLKDSVKKEISREDLKILGRGISKASKFLYDLGVEELYITRARGSHPGGTLSFIEDFSLEEDLYVCDSSLFKDSLGKPPIVSLIALAKTFVREYL